MSLVDPVRLLHLTCFFTLIYEQMNKMKRYVYQRASGESVKLLERIVMCERKTGKLVTGPAAPTENTLLSWLLRHPSFEVVQPTHQAPPPSTL